jgi:organic hydroperoxide reductase OsmC/OhrA
MSQHTVRLEWKLDTGNFLARQYSREHTWTFDGGLTVPASSSPSVVRVPYSNPAYVDPEEAFIAAIASCHMLWYLSLAAERGFVIERYADQATGVLSRDTNGKEWISAVTLAPEVTYGGEKRPTAEEEDALHHAAHEACFIANSVRTEITIQRKGEIA